MQINHRVLVATIMALTFVALTIKATRSMVDSRSEIDQRQTVSVSPFTSIELHDGVKAVLRYGAEQRVTVLKGSAETSLIAVANGERLVINKCKDKCPRAYHLEVEIVGPAFTGISIDDGGMIECRGNFPRQAEVKLAVRNGGTIDARSVVADRITATVVEGGGIFAKPETIMVASIVSGGIITYWGDARVTSSTQHGGQVIKGAAADADKPISSFGPSLAEPPVVPKVPNQPAGNP
ncbi:MAG: GIN domain-containing protein [Pyrinomonadaceae bacterium]|jgi:hypothetical protein